MAGALKPIGLALLSGLILTVGWVPAPRAATSATLDILPNDDAGTSIDRVEVGTLKPLPRQNQEAGKRPPSGNPLWSIPLSVLSATQERPIFSASRRPPPLAVVGPRMEPPPKVPVLEKPAERPSLALIGAVVGDSDAIAVFLDQQNKGIVRLRQGEAHAGWVLSSILRREVTLKKADQTEILVLPRPNVSPTSTETLGILPTEALGNAGTTYAPFIPRHTPKNGESDGL
jgi:general secretion pathway protein N